MGNSKPASSHPCPQELPANWQGQEAGGWWWTPLEQEREGFPLKWIEAFKEKGGGGRWISDVS